MTVIRCLKPSEVAELTEISERTLENLRLAGAGPAFVRLGKRKGIRYLESDVIAWIDSRRCAKSSAKQIANESVKAA